MEFALYDSEHGYYARHVSIGPEGDFSTSATLSPYLGSAISRWILAHPPFPQNVIEIGGGTGALATSVMRELRRKFSLGRLRRPGRPRLNYNLVESSPHLRAAQKKMLGRRAHWHETPQTALRSAGGTATLFSNELVDAFPPRVFRKTEGWEELFLAHESGMIVETWKPSPSLPRSTVFKHPWPEGQRVEVHESYHLWLRDWLPEWKTGRLLTIDYGGAATAIYHRRPAGTLRGYHRHQLRTGPELYQLPGRQDLTCDVNFDDLVSWGEELGLRTITLTDQQSWLAQGGESHSHVDRFLSDLEGAGQAFKVLLQERI